jgi:hypothetical protein
MATKQKCKNYIEFEHGGLCSSRQTSHLRLTNRHKTRRIRAEFTLTIDVGHPPPSPFEYVRTIRPGRSTIWFCCNRYELNSCEFLD